VVMTEQLGLDRSQVTTFRQWVEALLAPKMYPLTDDEMVAVTEVALTAQHHFAAVFEDRRRQPTDDLMSALANAHVEGGEEPLTMNELQDLVHQLIAGGFETTATAIAHGMWLLLRHPDQMALLRSDLDRFLPGFVEETLRIESPAQGLTRRTTRDTELAGTVIPAGSVVIVRYGAANHDGTQFPDPERFDITRSNLGTHVAFGHGAHFCVGAALARAEIATAFREVLTRLDDIRLARPLPDPAHRPNLLLMAFKEMHLEFSRATPA
jgi:cytochrome P450